MADAPAITRADSGSEEETAAIAAALAARLRPGDVVLLRGEMGTGKTTFVRAACRALGVTEPVTSPTFTLARRYTGGDGIAIGHLDLHRLGALGREDEELLDEELDPARIVFAEWPDVAAPLLPRIRSEIALAHAGGDRRTIEVAWHVREDE